MRPVSILLYPSVAIFRKSSSPKTPSSGDGALIEELPPVGTASSQADEYLCTSNSVCETGTSVR